MKRTLTCAIALAITFSAAPTFAENWKTIRKEADFRELVVGRKITWNGNDSVVNADGTLAGNLKSSGKLYGNWVWSGRFYCRNFVVNKKASGTNCAKVEVSGNTLRLTSDKGRGQPREFNMN